MRPILPVLAAILVGVAFVGAARAQADGAPAAVEDTATRAAKGIADYEAMLGDPAKTVQANRLLLWLGEIDDDSVTRYLVKQLSVPAGAIDRTATVLQAIGRVARPALFQDVWTLLNDDKTSPGVRQLAAAAIITMGNRPADKLIDMLRKSSESAADPVRYATIQAIVASKDDRLIRALSPLFDQGTSDDRIALLRRLEPVRDVPPISMGRIRSITGGSLLLGAVAWRQLAMEGHPRAKALAIDLLERMPNGPDNDVAAELIVGIAIVRDSDLYPLLLRYGASTAGPIKRALRDAAPHAAEDPDLMRYLATRGLEDERPAARNAALLLLKRAPKEAVQPLLEKVRRALRNPKKDALDLAAGLHELLAKDPSWRNDLLLLAASREPEVRTVGLSLLRELGSDQAIEYAQKSLGAKEWELRASAIRYLTSFRDVGSIPLLIARFGKEEGRLAAELANALFVHTGTRCFEKRAWSSWWDKNKVGFALPHEETVKSGMAGVAGQTSAYHGIPLVSKRVAFLIDTSGSMGARIGTDKNRNRLDAAKEEMARALASVPNDHLINVIPYSTAVLPLWKELRTADNDNKEKVLAGLKVLRPGGGTNIYGALEIAFQDPTVDTIFLLTDGEPSVGEVVVAEEIAEEVLRWNRMRQIVIHCIGLGIDSKLLKQLAEESGGVYKYVR